MTLIVSQLGIYVRQHVGSRLTARQCRPKWMKGHLHSNVSGYIFPLFTLLVSSGHQTITFKDRICFMVHSFVRSLCRFIPLNYMGLDHNNRYNLSNRFEILIYFEYKFEIWNNYNWTSYKCTGVVVVVVVKFGNGHNIIIIIASNISSNSYYSLVMPASNDDGRFQWMMVYMVTLPFGGRQHLRMLSVRLVC